MMFGEALTTGAMLRLEMKNMLLVCMCVRAMVPYHD